MAPGAGTLADLRTFGRYARRLPGFVRATITVEDARRRIEHQLAARESTFLDVLDRAVFANPHNPYRVLLHAAAIERGDVHELVGAHGLEGALERLRDAGVRVSLDEFKGRRPIERAGVAIPAGAGQFDNPLNAADFRAVTGGSASAARRVSVDLDLLEHEAAYHALFRETFALADRPFAVWRVVPPSASGINNQLRQVKLGLPVARWFNPHKAAFDAEGVKFAVFTAFTVRAARLAGARMQPPEYTPPQAAEDVARWLAGCVARGTPAVLDTQAALAVRACVAALEAGLDIAGTLFRTGGEPYTQAKADVVAQAGCRAVCHYTMAETGRVGVACGDQVQLDDVHVLTDKLAVLQHDRSVDADGTTVGALSYTSLLPSAAKLMLNVESDDYGILERRPCGCPFGALGLDLHLHQIRSFEKLTAEGNHFLGSDLLALVEEVLPRRFGGTPTDFQLVEEEVGGLPKVTVVVRPSVGAAAEADVLATVFAFLRLEQRNHLMTAVWEQGDTVRVVREEPSITAAGKILPLARRR